MLDLPEGLEATDSTTYKLTGIDGFDLSVSKEKGGKRLVVKARLKPHVEYEPLKDLYARIQGVRSATLSIDGLKVTDQVARNQDSTVVAYAYGAHEVVSSSSNDAIINKDTRNTTTSIGTPASPCSSPRSRTMPGAMRPLRPTSPIS